MLQYCNIALSGGSGGAARAVERRGASGARRHPDGRIYARPSISVDPVRASPVDLRPSVIHTTAPSFYGGPRSKVTKINSNSNSDSALVAGCNLDLSNVSLSTLQPAYRGNLGQSVITSSPPLIGGMDTSFNCPILRREPNESCPIARSPATRSRFNRLV